MQSARLRVAVYVLALTAANTVRIRFITTVSSPARRIGEDENIAVYRSVDDRPKLSVSTAKNSSALG
jgi:hypothetical protein